MNYYPMRDGDMPNDALYPFQSGYVSRGGSSTPYVIGLIALAILAVVGVSVVSVGKQNLLPQEATNEASGTDGIVSRVSTHSRALPCPSHAIVMGG